MKYFITGASGFLGKHLIPEIQKLDFTILKGDLNDKELLNKNLKDVDTVIHLAALIKSKKKSSFYKVNVLGTKNLIEACVRAGVKNIIFISSYLADFFYKKSAYGQSKLEGEKIIKKSGLNFIILRPTLIYGKGDDKNLTKLIKLIRKFPLVPIFGHGDYYLQPVYVKDVVKTINFILEKNIFNKKTYNLAGELLTYNEIINQICKKLNKKRIKIHLPIGLIKVLVGIYEKILPGHFITVEQINNLTRKKKVVDINEAKKDLSFTPAPFKIYED